MAKLYETFSFLLSVAGFALAFLGLKKDHKALRTMSGGMLFSVGIGGITLVWSDWSARAGAHMSVRAFARPVKLTKANVGGLCTHSGQLIAGIVMLAWS